MDIEQDRSYTADDIDRCIYVLTHLVDNYEDLAALPKEKRIALMKVSGQLSRPDSDVIRQRNKAIRNRKKQRVATAERTHRAATGIRRAREASIFATPSQQAAIADSSEKQPELNSPRNCYVCKAEFSQLHHFYDSMCPRCAEFNYRKRFQSADLRGQVALITGSRLKIGYQATVMMLRSGATVIATTRFPVDSALRYAKEHDFAEWGARLHVYGLDLRHTPSVELLCDHVERTYGRLDILINNAAQTVRRPPGFYSHLMGNENRAFAGLPEDAQTLLKNFNMCLNELAAPAFPDSESSNALQASWQSVNPGVGMRESARLSQVPFAYDSAPSPEAVFPQGAFDADLQQVDLRTTNSWRLKLGEIQTAEMLEIQLVNAIAPFVLCNKLAPVMKKENTGQKHIVNVTAMEGKFLRFKKGERHPHTNMAKAALNMLTHTSASELADHGIFMNAVDTGWVTDEDPAQLSKAKEDLHDFQPPLDIVDGAARICDPIFDGINSAKHWCGKFLKDYFPIDW